MLVLAALLVVFLLIIASSVHGLSLLGLLIGLAVLGAGFDKWRAMFR